MALSLLSLNVRGLRNGTKRKWGCGDIFFSHGSSHSAGVAILFKQLDGKVLDYKSDVKGHWLMVTLEFNDSNYILLNVYGFNNRIKNRKMFSNLGTMIDNWMTQYSTDRVIVTGDFNVVADEWLDRYPSQFRTHSFDPLISDFSESLNLVDIWRKMNPDIKQYTWWNNTSRSQCSTLDFWLISKNLTELSSECNIRRHIHNHTRLILDLLDYNHLISHDSFILFLDFFKAFDTLEHQFLLETLKNLISARTFVTSFICFIKI
uniref:exodeoxyribonuclease III n=1 Tax=Salarias fasciatus TaxID=181472 RepID=A0A672FYM4_SALFA